MGFFEDKFTSVGRKLDTTVKGAADSARAAADKAREAPLSERLSRLREDIKHKTEDVMHSVEAKWENPRRKRWADLPEETRKRLGRLSMLAALAVSAGVIWFFARPAPPQEVTPEEIATLAALRGKMSVAPRSIKPAAPLPSARPGSGTPRPPR